MFPPAGLENEWLLELFFSQSLDGFFFMMLDEPVEWGITSARMRYWTSCSSICG